MFNYLPQGGCGDQGWINAQAHGGSLGPSQWLGWQHHADLAQPPLPHSKWRPEQQPVLCIPTAVSVRRGDSCHLREGRAQKCPFAWGPGMLSPSLVGTGQSLQSAWELRCALRCRRSLRPHGRFDPAHWRGTCWHCHAAWDGQECCPPDTERIPGCHWVALPSCWQSPGSGEGRGGLR